MEVTLPWPPTLNSYYGHNRIGAFYIKKKGQNYRVAVYRALQRQVGFPKFSKPVAVFMTFYPPPAVKEPWDIDNHKKALFDAMTLANFWADDSLVHEDHSYKGKQGGCGRVVIQVEEM